MSRVLIPALLTLGLAACSTPSGPSADRLVYRTSEGPHPALEPEDPLRDVAPPAPRDDLAESERVAFHERWEGRQRYMPPFERPPRSETTTQRVRRKPSHLWFTVPFSLALGWTIYDAVHHHGYHGHGSHHW